MADEELGLNYVDHESENVSDETISKSESSDEEINLLSKEKKNIKIKTAEMDANLHGRSVQLVT